MATFLKTEQLKVKIEHLTKKMDVSNSLLFEKPIKNGGNGLYIFTDEWGYNLMLLEHGKIQEKILSRNLFDILYWSLDYLVVDKASILTKENRKENATYQEKMMLMYHYQLETWSLLGINFRKRAEIEISDLINKNILI